MTKDEIIKALRDMARYPTVTLPRDSEALKVAADLLAQPQQEPVPAAMKTVIEAMQQDPDYAWGWHCNIAMSFVDAGGDHYTGNQGAARFMRTLANVEPAHELPPPPPQRKPLTDEEINDIAKNYALNNPTTPLHFARAIEAKLKEKNNIT